MNALNRIGPRAPAQLAHGAVPSPAAAPPPRAAFAEVLRGQMNRGVRFSAHAQQRLDSRAISLSPEDHGRIARAVDQAEAKGSRESLLLMDEVALVVSVPNRTVITALGKNEAANTVFTNIDSAVMVPDRLASSNETTQPGPDPLRGSPRAADRPMRRAELEV